MSNYFRFKQFIICHDKCAMKVGTDAVLLGAWANPDNCKTILDIGTGTGVIAIMLAQKSNLSEKQTRQSDAVIDAIEMDENAFLQAKENVNACKWSSRISVHHLSLQLFHRQKKEKYDLIVSNPPFFAGSMKAAEQSRHLARHTDLLSFEDLLQGVLSLLSPTGKFCVILPSKEGDHFRSLAEKNKLYLSKLTRVRTKENKSEEKRLLMQFEFDRKTFYENLLVIEKDEPHSYTDEYKELTKDYYLGF